MICDLSSGATEIRGESDIFAERHSLVGQLDEIADFHQLSHWWFSELDVICGRQFPAAGFSDLKLVSVHGAPSGRTR
jgi:hypothetical protein